MNYILELSMCCSAPVTFNFEWYTCTECGGPCEIFTIKNGNKDDKNE
jgi:hypothetical protein